LIAVETRRKELLEITGQTGICTRSSAIEEIARDADVGAHSLSL